jgi:hypothetical protein
MKSVGNTFLIEKTFFGKRGWRPDQLPSAAERVPESFVHLAAPLERRGENP